MINLKTIGLVASAYLASTVMAQRCRTDNLAATSNGAACVNQIRALGNRNCRVSSTPTTFCTVGDATLVTTSGGGFNSIDVPCNELAVAGGQILDRCTVNRGGQQFTAGSQIPPGRPYQVNIGRSF